MHTHVNSAAEHLSEFILHLPQHFETGGDVLHTGRNTIKAFRVGGEELVVKRYKRPNAFNTFVYSFLRKSKARRAYEHALRLQSLGIGTPGPVAWCECRRRG